MYHRYLATEITELMASTLLVSLTGVSKCGSHKYTFRAPDHISCVSFSVSKLQTQVVAISLLDFLEFIVNVKFVTEVLSVTEIMLRL